MTAHRHRVRLRRVRHHKTIPALRLELPPRDIAGYAAYAQSCRPAWLAAGYGDRDPQVLALAAVYTQWVGGTWEQVTR